MAFWIFQGNPRTRYRLSAALASLHQHDMKMTWDVRQHLGGVHAGDTVYMWEAGSGGGLVAVATILTEPGEAKEEAWELEFHVLPTPNRDYPQVLLQATNIFPKPISRYTVAATAGLEKLLIFRFGQMTNYPLSEDEARAIDNLIEERGWDLATPPPRRTDQRASSAEHGNRTAALSEAVRESHVESVLAENPAVLEPGLVLVGRQVSAPPVGRIDLLCKDANGSYVVVELKKCGGGTQSVVDQITGYMTWVKEKLANNGEAVRGMIVVGHPEERLTYSAAAVPLLETKCWSMSISSF